MLRIFYKFVKFLYFRIVENGRETVMTFENDTMTSKTVNGVTQALT